MNPTADPELPFLSDRYRLLRLVGTGGMATVYLAEDLKHHRQVAVKVMNPEIAHTMGSDRFHREIGIAARLNHPHVLPLFDSGASESGLFYVMPYVEGESLRVRLRRETRLGLDESLRLSREVLSALGHAHQHGIVHRDIKPENILLADGIALVADFGIARAMSSGPAPVDASAEDAPTQAMTALGAIIGTPRYMSPEQAIGESVDARTDLYALACVLFEMLTGEAPFDAPSPGALIRLHLTAEPKSLTTLCPTLPEDLGSVIAKGLAKDPAARYESAARFAEAIEVAARPASPGAKASPTAPEGISAGPSGAPHNLPRPRSRFIGRSQELEACARLLEGSRLLTLTGIGGSGKTRLALELGARVLPFFPDGVWFVDLAPLTDAGRVPAAVAGALGVREVAGEELGATLARHVASRALLLILDNCEHLLGACAQLADALLESSDGPKIVATSREGLGIAGERLFALRSLGVPAPDTARDPAAVRSSEAVELFVDRARAAVPAFDLDEHNASVIAEICRRLDGIPLAIELAAARIKILSVEQIRAKLDDRFRLLTGGRAGLPRHKTLQAAIEWSYELLSPDEQRLLRQLSILAGGATLGAVARMTDPGADEFAAMDRLGRLVDKSLVLVDRSRGGDPRYGLLETVRQFARDRLLSDPGEAAAVRSAHYEEFAALAERAFAERLTREEEWSARLEDEHDNLRTALASVRGVNPEQHLRLAGALGWFWQVRTHALEGREHLLAALDAAPSAPTPERARALWGAANLLTWQGDASDRTKAWMREAVDLWRRIGDVREVALALEGIGWVQLLGGEDDDALTTFRECLRLQRAQGDPVLVNRAMVALAQTLVAVGQVDEAWTLSQEIIVFGRDRQDRRSEHFGWHYLADCRLIEGRCEESLRLYGKALALARVLGDRVETGFEIQGIAMSLAGLGDARSAHLLEAAVSAEFARLGVDPHMRFWDALLERYLAGASRTLGEAAGAVEEEGARLSFDAACERAREVSSGASGAGGDASGGGGSSTDSR